MAGPDIITVVDDPNLYQRVDVEILCRKRDIIISTSRIGNFACASDLKQLARVIALESKIQQKSYITVKLKYGEWYCLLLFLIFCVAKNCTG